jgi:hypothetical protein
MDNSDGVPQAKPKGREPKDRLRDLLEEALSGSSARSKKTIIKEALKVVNEL